MVRGSNAIPEEGSIARDQILHTEIYFKKEMGSMDNQEGPHSVELWDGPLGKAKQRGEAGGLMCSINEEMG